MPMPPTITPYDPRKNRIQQHTQQSLQSGMKEGAPTPSAAVQSNLPPMPQASSIQQTQVQQAGTPQAQTMQAGVPQQTQTKPVQRKDLPVSYQQQAAAVIDPRYSQALAQKVQQQVQQQQQVLAQQQAEFQKQMGQISTPSVERVNALLNKITSGTATDADISEYQNLQQTEFKGPEGLEKTANIAALRQLSQSPELLAQQYGGFGGPISATELQQSLGVRARSPELTQALQSASQLAEKESKAEQIAREQSELAKGKAASLKTQAETGVKAAETKYMGELTQEQKADVESKKSSLDNLKAGLFLGKKVFKSDLANLGLSEEDVKGLKGLNLSKIEGVGDIKSTEDLDKAVETLKNKKLANESLTPEQEKLVSSYSVIKQLERGQDEANVLAYAKKEDLAKINALRKLTGQEPIKEDILGTGEKSGTIDKSLLATLKGQMQTEASSGYAESPEEIQKQIDKLEKGTTYKSHGKGSGYRVPTRSLPGNEEKLAGLKAKLAGMSDIYRDVGYYSPEESTKKINIPSISTPSKAKKPTQQKRGGK